MKKGQQETEEGGDQTERRRGSFSLFRAVPTSRIRTVTRISLDRGLRGIFGRLKPGAVLDVGSSGSPYKKYIPATEYLRLDVNSETRPDICCDLHNIQWQSDYFDTAIATEVLEHLYDPQRAVDEIRRVLKPGGVCVLSTRFIYPYHPDPKDYYRFTWDSLRHLFRDFSNVEVLHRGNRIHVLWQLINMGDVRLLLNIFNPLVARIHFKKTKFPSGFIVYAVK